MNTATMLPATTTAEKPSPRIQLHNCIPGVRMLIETYAYGVKEHEKFYALSPGADGMWMALDIKSIVKSNNYKIVWEWMNEIMDMKLLDITGEKGSRRNLRQQIISTGRMGEGDAMMIVFIPRASLPYLREVAELPHIPFTARMRSPHDRPLYDLMTAMLNGDAVVSIAGEQAIIKESVTRPGWKNITVTNLLRLLKIEGMDFGAFNMFILKPRIKFLSNAQNTDLKIECQPVKAPGSKKVVSLDFLVSRQETSGKSFPIIDIREVNILAYYGLTGSESETITRELNPSEVTGYYMEVDEYLRDNKGKCTPHEGAMHVLRKMFPMKVEKNHAKKKIAPLTALRINPETAAI